MGKGMFDGPLLGKETPEIDMSSCDPTVHELAQIINNQAERIFDLEIAVSQLQGQFHAATRERMNKARCNIRRRALAQMVHEKDGAGLDRSMYELRVYGCQTPNAEKSKPSSGDRS